MANTTTFQNLNLLRGQSGTKGDARVYEIAVTLSGTYATATKPNFSIRDALRAQNQDFENIWVHNAIVFRDAIVSAGTRYTATSPTLSTVDSGSTNDVLTFTVGTTDSTHKNGSQAAEVGDGTTIDGTFVFLVVVSLA